MSRCFQICSLVHFPPFLQFQRIPLVWYKFPAQMAQINVILITEILVIALHETVPQILHHDPGAGNAHGLGTCPRVQQDTADLPQLKIKNSIKIVI